VPRAQLGVNELVGFITPSLTLPLVELSMELAGKGCFCLISFPVTGWLLAFALSAGAQPLRVKGALPAFPAVDVPCMVLSQKIYISFELARFLAAPEQDGEVFFRLKDELIRNAPT